MVVTSKIVLGGITCDTGKRDYPSWYTRVSHYKDWIICIMKANRKHRGNKSKTEAECDSVAKSLSTQKIDGEVCKKQFGFNSLDLRENTNTEYDDIFSG